MKILLSIHYWFNLRPGELSAAGLRFFVVFLVLLFAMTFIFGLLKKRQKSMYNRIWRQMHSFGLTNLIIGLIVLFFVYEMVPFLSARFWFFIWGAGMAVWLFFIGKNLWAIPRIRQEIAREKEYKKYIP